MGLPWIRQGPLRIEATGPRVFALQLLLYYGSILPLLWNFESSPHGDVRLYHETIRGLFSGVWPYADEPFEYPPYALIWFLIPALGKGLIGFQYLFQLQLLVIDLGIKLWLMVEGERLTRGFRALLPLGLFCLFSAFLNHFYLQRIDLIPTALTVASLIAFYRGRWLLAGLLLTVGAGTKLYPALLALPLLVLAWRQGGALQMIQGAVLGALPLILVSPVLPWWEFLLFHSDRGFEVESLYAAVIWLWHFGVDLDLEWAWVEAWQELKGPDADPWVPYALGWFAATVVFTNFWAAWHIRRQTTTDPVLLARVALLVILPFVAFNIVLSPQYLIWLGPLAALGASHGRWEPMALIGLTAVLTPIHYPSPQFSSGFTLVQTAILVFRNSLLVVTWLYLLREVSRTTQKPAAGAPDGNA